jgi:DnaJ-class molecular chaperone
VQIPNKISEKQVELLKQFEEEEKKSNISSSKSKSFIDDAVKRVKSFLGVTNGGGDKKREPNTSS